MATAHTLMRLAVVTATAFALSACLSDSDDSPTELVQGGSESVADGSTSGGGSTPPPPPPPPPATGGDSSGNVDPVVLYSYDPNLKNAAPVGGAETEPTLLYLFEEPSQEWVERGITHLEYRCCEGIEGPGAGEPHGPSLHVSYEPWSLAVDLSAYEPGGVRRMEVVAKFNDGGTSEKRGFRFSIAGGPEPNTAPRISGQPPSSVVAGATYSFTPEATDPDGDTIAFVINNRPDWASFDTVTGRLRGTPDADDVGEYRDIYVYASDGQTSSALGPFSISVESVGMGAATLDWEPPTEREDGTPLTNLAGYRLLYGQTSGGYTEEIRIENPGVTSFVVDNLNSGEWYFAMTAFDADGMESALSEETTRTIP